MLLLIIILTFGCIALAVMSLHFMLSRPPSVVNARLERIDPSLALVENNPVTTMAERVAEPLNRIVPISAVEALKLQKQLLLAGYRSPEAAMVFRAIQRTLMIAMLVLVVMVCLILNRPLNNFVIWGIIALALGFYAPKYVLKKKIAARQQRITWALPDMMDLLVVAVEAGLSLNAALNRVGEELKELRPDMHHEIDLLNLEIRVGRGREQALRNLAARTEVDDIRSFVALLIQADRYGSSIAGAVRIFAESLRTKRRQRAMQASQKAALKLLFPLTCFLFPVVLIVILGPAILNLMDLLFR